GLLPPSPAITRVRLPSASPPRCDEAAAKVSHLHSNQQRLTAHSSIPATGSATGPATRTTTEIADALLTRYVGPTIEAVAQRRATWTATNLLAEAARTTRALRLPDPVARIALLDRIMAAALDRCVALDPPANVQASSRFAGAEAERDSAEASEPAFTTWAILAAEARLLGAHQEMAAATADPGAIEAFLAAPVMPGAPRLSADQARAAVAIAASGRRLDVLVGPAGAGKTRALWALRVAWEQTNGSGSVIGLAPSATAAAQVAVSLRIGADTLAKWIHESDPETAGAQPWQLKAGQLVIVDEAAMAPTEQLDRLVAQASAAGAKVVLVGDHAQLGAIEAGGAFALLVEEGNAVELEQLHRFSRDWEATATRALRDGDPAALDIYAAHGRLHDGVQEAMTERAYRAWATDTTSARHSLLLAADRDTVTALNRRARNDRIRAGAIDTTGEVPLRDGTTAAAGDVITTRRNNRRLTRPDGGHVRNGDRWHIAAVHPDGSLEATPLAQADPERSARPPAAVRLPADYVREHVELGYAMTIHRAQGATADTAHVIAGPGMSRETFYVAMTRGRHANHAW
ncbi:AAA family ATPase, partial [Sporichthya sp.]|uniref:ATP-dependent DNA helicase n=1 Tax=Sporichthya sp. TaxID=65475 RepID=UPI0025E55C3A